MSKRRTDPFTAVRGGPRTGRLIGVLLLLLTLAILTGYYGPTFL